jgi:hypothetical protein
MQIYFGNVTFRKISPSLSGNLLFLKLELYCQVINNKSADLETWSFFCGVVQSEIGPDHLGSRDQGHNLQVKDGEKVLSGCQQGYFVTVCQKGHGWWLIDTFHWPWFFSLLFMDQRGWSKRYSLWYSSVFLQVRWGTFLLSRHMLDTWLGVILLNALWNCEDSNEENSLTYYFTLEAQLDHSTCTENNK